MNDLNTYLRATSADPPPTRVDLDALISGELRRARRLRLGGALGGTTAAVLAVILAGTLAAGDWRPGRGTGAGATVAPTARVEPTASVASGEPIPCGIVVLAPSGVYQSFTPVRPDPTGENPGDVARRLSATLDAGLTRLLPSGATLTDMEHVPGCDRREFVFDPQRRSYQLSLEIKTPSGSGILGVTVMPHPVELTGCPGRSSPEATCTTGQFPGARYAVEIAPLTGIRSSGEKILRYSVFVYRDDGTMIVLTSTNQVRGDPGRPGQTTVAPPLSEEQLVELGRAPGLTLYP